MTWQPGPLPSEDVWEFGGVVLRGHPGEFHFASFLGDRARLVDGTEVRGDDVLLWNNCLRTATGVTCRAKETPAEFKRGGK